MQACSGNIYKKNAGIAFFFGVILRCSKGITEGGPAILENQKDYAHFDHLHLIQCKITAPGSPGFSTCERDGSLLYCTQRQAGE